MKKSLLLLLIAAFVFAGCSAKENKSSDPTAGNTNPPGQNEQNTPPSPLAALTDTMTTHVFGKQVKEGDVPLTKDIRQFFYEYAKQYDYRFLPVMQEKEFADFNLALLYAFYQKNDYTEMTMSTAFVDAIFQRDFPGVTYEHQTPKEGLFTLKDNVYTPVGFSYHGSSAFAITKLTRQTENETAVYTAHLKNYDFWEMDGLAGEKMETYSKNAQFIYRREQEDAYKGLSFFDAIKKVVIDGEATQMPHCLADLELRFTVSFNPSSQEYQLHYLSVEETSHQ